MTLDMLRCALSSQQTIAPNKEHANKEDGNNIRERHQVIPYARLTGRSILRKYYHTKHHLSNPII